MKNLKSDLFKVYEPNRIMNLTNIVGGAPQGSKWEYNHTCGSDTIDLETSDGISVCIDGQTKPCDFVPITGYGVFENPISKK